MKKSFRYLILLFFLVTADQFLKYIFLEKSTCNKNIAWGIPIASGVFYFVWTVIMAALVFVFLKNNFSHRRFALVLIFSGAISNIFDRAIHGCVVDFIDLKFWPVFNLADVYITIGTIALIANATRNSKSQTSNNK